MAPLRAGGSCLLLFLLLSYPRLISSQHLGIEDQECLCVRQTSTNGSQEVVPHINLTVHNDKHVTEFANFFFNSSRNDTCPAPCTGLRSLVVSGDGVTSLLGFKNITHVTAEIRIENSNLTSLEGLHSITWAAAITLRNVALESLTGLRGLTAIRDPTVSATSNSLSLYNITGIRDLTGLEKLEQIAGALVVESCPKLESLSGLDNLRFIHMGLSIQSNQRLRSLIGLKSLEVVSSSVLLVENDLESLYGLDKAMVGGELGILKNKNRMRIFGGFSKARPGSFLAINIDNASWPLCIMPGETEFLKATSRYKDFNIFPAGYDDDIGCRTTSREYCIRGLPCYVDLSELSVKLGQDPLLHLSIGDQVMLSKDICGVCDEMSLVTITNTSRIHLQSADNYLRPGDYSICRCPGANSQWSMVMGPIAPLKLIGPNSASDVALNLDATVTDTLAALSTTPNALSIRLYRGHHTPITLPGDWQWEIEGSQLHISVDCEESAYKNLSTNLTGSKAALDMTDEKQLRLSVGVSIEAGVYLFVNTTTLSRVKPSVYELCWTVLPCDDQIHISDIDGQRCIPAWDKPRHKMKIGELSLPGPWSQDSSLIRVGENVTISNEGLFTYRKDFEGLATGDCGTKARLLETCGSDLPDNAVIQSDCYDRNFQFNVTRPGLYKKCWCMTSEEMPCNESHQFIVEFGKLEVHCRSGWSHTENICSECTAGRFSETGEKCLACPPNTAAKSGQAACQVCEFPLSATQDQLQCAVMEPILFCALLICVTISLSLLWTVFRYTNEVEEVHLEEGDRGTTSSVSIQTTNRLVIHLRRPHWVRKGAKPPLVLWGTGHPFLDTVKVHDHFGFEFGSHYFQDMWHVFQEDVSKMVKQRPFDSHVWKRRCKKVGTEKLQVLDDNLMPITSAFETSRGTLHIPFPYTISSVCVPVMINLIPVPVIFPLVTCIALCAPIIHTMHIHSPAKSAWKIPLSILVATVIAAAIHYAMRRQAGDTVIKRKLAAYKEKLRSGNSDPRQVARGPTRAIKAEAVWDLFSTFITHVRQRDMYYIDTNLTRPLTADHKLSFAEMVGPQDVQWFVSHFWGSPFCEFARSIRKHAESVVADRSRRGFGQKDWRNVTYWVCSLSINQWKISEELGANWDESSFYLALKSGLCLGTAMILDMQALPLTRAWCLFELLQTDLLRREKANFTGLWLCTKTGVLHEGRAGVDVAMATAKRLINLRLEDAQASVQKDKDMIDNLVSEMPGGFKGMNAFVKSSIRDAIIAMKDAFEGDAAKLLDELQTDIASFEMANKTESEINLATLSSSASGLTEASHLELSLEPAQPSTRPLQLDMEPAQQPSPQDADMTV